ncbi:MAG: efflux RND transporter periplasmic adaptor subunit [Sphingomonas sp.]|uniref:efflux RND transporter periplasmic adaptor subunit n=1 Tax=Sphingomonas sp. TaxID=28214 RepID=UPI0025FE3BF7|nr:efflux RND transporter periplasmic adaptor subunit [Sphingomonas sp.]MBX3563616.1 efflux RND transporter periplasmic adaptor subunit [Sphingomonas sp.]
MNRSFLAAAAAALALTLAGCGGGKEAQGGPPPAAVTVATPLVQDIVDWDEYVGRFEAVQNVEVRPRATGFLASAHFRDGQFVQRGQLLFRVDPRPALAALAQARAQAAQAQATLANARTELARSQNLAAQKAASQEELEQRQATLRSAEAQVAAAGAVVRARQLDLAFTRVTAPISGRISERRVDPGNAVVADQTVLTTIVSVNPLHFVFQGSEALLLKYQRQGAGTQNGTPVRVKLSDESDYSHSGTLDFIDNAIDTGAGTIRARAVIPNPGGFLKPGMFGNLRLEASRPYPALLVPDTAVIADAARQVVYVVGKDGSVAARPVQTGPLLGTLRVIRSGITRDDRVIIDGTQRAMPGQKVQAKQGKIQPGAAPASAPPGSSAPPSSSAQAVGR